MIRHFKKKRKKSCFLKYEKNVKYVFSNSAGEQGTENTLTVAKIYNEQEWKQSKNSIKCKIEGNAKTSDAMLKLTKWNKVSNVIRKWMTTCSLKTVASHLGDQSSGRRANWATTNWATRFGPLGDRPRPSAGFFKRIRLAEPYFRLISDLAEFLRRLRNSAENTPEHHRFG